MYTHRLTVERRTPARNLLSYILCITVSTQEPIWWAPEVPYVCSQIIKIDEALYHSDTVGMWKK